MKEDGRNKYKEKIKKLFGLVVDVVKGLCCKILWYKGK